MKPLGPSKPKMSIEYILAAAEPKDPYPFDEKTDMPVGEEEE